MHYARWRAHGDPGTAERRKAPDGAGYLDSGGYRWIYDDNGDNRREHHVVMEAMIGRRLFPEETVHHKNGIRSDNRRKNLELWASAHPYGQRISDLVAFAHWVLNRYEGEACR